MQLPVAQSVSFVPTSALNYNSLRCYWIPLDVTACALGYPKIATGCTFALGAPNSYAIAKPYESLAPGAYVVRIAYDEVTAPNAAALTFDLNNASAPAAQYSELLFTLRTQQNATYVDVLRVALLEPFALVTLTHNSVVSGEYDYLFLRFALHSALAAPVANQTETELVVDVRSEYFDAQNGLQDNGLNTDPNLFANEPAGAFVNGESYPYKLYNATLAQDVTLAAGSGATLTFQFGQWTQCGAPLRFRLVA